MEADERYAQSLSEQTEASSQPAPPIGEPLFPSSGLPLSPYPLAHLATGERFDVLASPRLFPLTSPQAKGQLPPPPIVPSFGVASTRAETPARESSTSSPSAFKLAQRSGGHCPYDGAGQRGPAR